MLNFLTYALLAGYFALVITIGVRAGYKQSSEDFLISDRNRGGFWAGVSLASAWFGGDFLSFYSGLTYSFGWAPLVWTQIGFALGFWVLVYFVQELKTLADKYKMYTLPDYFYQKYSRRCGAALQVCNISLFFGWLMLQFVVGGKLISGFTGFSYTIAVVGMAALTLPYLVFGGYKAVLNTDIVQFLFLSVLSLFLVGKAFDQNITQMPPLSTIGSMGGSATFSTLILMASWIIASGDIWQHLYATRSVKAAKSSLFWALVVSTVLTTIMTMIFLLALPLAQEKAVLEKDFLMFALQNLFPTVLMPFVILLLTISIGSSLDTAAFGTSLSLTNDLVKFGLIPSVRLAFATRISLCVVMVLAILGAYIATDVIDIIFGIAGIASCSAVGLIASFWRSRFSEPAIFWSLILGIGCYILNLVQGWSGAWFDLLPLGTAIVGLLTTEFLYRFNGQRSN